MKLYAFTIFRKAKNPKLKTKRRRGNGIGVLLGTGVQRCFLTGVVESVHATGMILTIIYTWYSEKVLFHRASREHSNIMTVTTVV